MTIDQLVSRLTSCCGAEVLDLDASPDSKQARVTLRIRDPRRWLVYVQRMKEAELGGRFSLDISSVLSLKNPVSGSPLVKAWRMIVRGKAGGFDEAAEELAALITPLNVVPAGSDEIELPGGPRPAYSNGKGAFPLSTGGGR